MYVSESCSLGSNRIAPGIGQARRCELIHAVGFHINGFEVAHGKAGLLATRVFGNDMFIGFDSPVVIIILIIQ